MLVATKAVLPVPARRFPGLQTGRLSARRVYLDNACLTPTPAEVCDAVRDYYTQPPGCPLRNNSGRSGELETRIRDARESIRDFIRARYSDEIIFTPNTTFGINLLSGAFLGTPGKVLITDLEHNSNRLPWLAHERMELPWPPGEPFPMEAYHRALREQQVKLVSITATSNVTGQAPPVREVVREAAAQGVPVHLDAAQAFSSGWLDVTEDRPEFLSFSLHKAYGPSGLGGLYVRREWLPRLQPTYCGAGTVDDHFEERSTWTAGAPRMEFGLQNYAAVHAVPAAMKLLAGLPPHAVREHYARLNTALREQLRDIPGLRVVGPDDPRDAHHVCSFYLPSDALRLAQLLDMAGNFQVRAGRLCAHHWFHRYDVPDVVRVSFGIHNSLQEVEAYGNVFRKILRHYL